MAKHGRKFRRYLKGKIDIDIPLLTLASEDVLGENLTDNVDERAWLSSVKAAWTFSGFTPVDGDGPILVGLAHSDYTDAEVEEWIESGTSWKEGDKIAQERSKRLIRRVGIFEAPLSTTDSTVLDNGIQITTKCGWILTQGQTLKIWAFNMGTGALTTGAFVHVVGHANLWPQ